jgi:hypothetical protein
MPFVRNIGFSQHLLTTPTPLSSQHLGRYGPGKHVVWLPHHSWHDATFFISLLRPDPSPPAPSRVPRRLPLQLFEGFYYASAHAHDVDGDQSLNDGNKYVDIDADFEMAPGEPNDVLVCNAHLWACERLFFADGSSAYTGLNITKKPDNKGNNFVCFSDSM